MVHGRIAWDDHELWETYGQCAAAVGLEWAGTWVRFKEFPHVQFKNWKTIMGVS